MHELSIAQSLVDLATEAAQSAGAIGVQSVRLRLGPLSGVAEDALHFSWEVVITETLLAGAQLSVEAVPVVIYCASCQANQTPNSTQWLRCPICGAPPAQIVQGRELELVAVEIIMTDDPYDEHTFT